MEKVAAIFVVSFFPLFSPGSAEENAMKVAATAAYKQTGMEENINSYIEAKVPKDVKYVIQNFGTITNVVINKKVEYTWTF